MQHFLVRTFAVCLLLALQSVSAITDLPRTGQTEPQTRSDDGELQHGIEWPAPRFIDNKDGTLTDNLTGLMWIKDSFCANHYISGAATTQWHDALAFTDKLNQQSLATPCKEYTANHKDWRTPNLNELTSLIRAGLANNTSISDWLFIPTDSSGAFSEIGIVADAIWTSTTTAENPEQAWVVNLRTGEYSTQDKTLSTQLASIFSPVRTIDKTTTLASGQSVSYIEKDDGDLQMGIVIPDPRFIATENGTVIDKLTGLMWLQDANCANPGGSNWQTNSNSIHRGLITTPFFDNCPEYTPTLIGDFPEEWRIPNINELRSLIDYGEFDPALDENHPFSIFTDLPFWSSTSANNNPQTEAWTVSLINGTLNPNTAKSQTAYTWPVRGPVEFADISVSHKALEFNSLFVNSEQQELTLEIFNTGNAVLQIELLRLVNDNDQAIRNNFSIGRDGCSDRRVDLDTACSVVINFTPEQTGTLQAFLKISSDALGVEDLLVPIVGDGLAATSTKKSNLSCFIATAAYGSYLEPEVQVLRSFRDSVLLQYEWGKTLVNFYYQVSPPLAAYIAQNEALRSFTRALLSPVVYSIKYPSISLILLLLLGFGIIKRMYHH